MQGAGSRAKASLMPAVIAEGASVPLVTMSAIHSTKISKNSGPKLNGSFEVDHFSWWDRLEFWLNGSRL